MSYCRWSSDDWLCDVYVYLSTDDYYYIHVADKRVVYPEPLPAEPTNGDVLDELQRDQAVMMLYSRSPKVDIGLPFDGETFVLRTAKECVDCLTSLKDLGYNVPQYAIDRLLEEHK